MKTKVRVRAIVLFREKKIAAAIARSHRRTGK